MVSSCFLWREAHIVTLKSDPKGATSQRQSRCRDRTQRQKSCTLATLSWSKLPLLGCTCENPPLKDPRLVSCRASLATRTSSTVEEKKNICKSSKGFSYPGPTQGIFGNHPSGPPRTLLGRAPEHTHNFTCLSSSMKRCVLKRSAGLKFMRGQMA